MKKELRLEREKCTLCGICQGSCPVGSIRVNFQIIQAKFNLNQSFCPDGCDICVRSCPEKALSFDKSLVFYGSEKEWIVKTKRCRICHSALPVISGDFCAECRRKNTVVREGIRWRSVLWKQLSKI